MSASQLPSGSPRTGEDNRWHWRNVVEHIPADEKTFYFAYSFQYECTPQIPATFFPVTQFTSGNTLLSKPKITKEACANVVDLKEPLKDAKLVKVKKERICPMEFPIVYVGPFTGGQQPTDEYKLDPQGDFLKIDTPGSQLDLKVLELNADFSAPSQAQINKLVTEESSTRRTFRDMLPKKDSKTVANRNPTYRHPLLEQYTFVISEMITSEMLFIACAWLYNLPFLSTSASAILASLGVFVAVYTVYMAYYCIAWPFKARARAPRLMQSILPFRATFGSLLIWCLFWLPLIAMWPAYPAQLHGDNAKNHFPNHFHRPSLFPCFNRSFCKDSNVDTTVIKATGLSKDDTVVKQWTYSRRVSDTDFTTTLQYSCDDSTETVTVTPNSDTFKWGDDPTTDSDTYGVFKKGSDYYAYCYPDKERDSTPFTVDCVKMRAMHESAGTDGPEGSISAGYFMATGFACIFLSVFGTYRVLPAVGALASITGAVIISQQSNYSSSLLANFIVSSILCAAVYFANSDGQFRKYLKDRRRTAVRKCKELDVGENNLLDVTFAAISISVAFIGSSLENLVWLFWLFAGLFLVIVVSYYNWKKERPMNLFLDKIPSRTSYQNSELEELLKKRYHYAGRQVDARSKQSMPSWMSVHLGYQKVRTFVNSSTFSNFRMLLIAFMTFVTFAYPEVDQQTSGYAQAANSGWPCMSNEVRITGGKSPNQCHLRGFETILPVGPTADRYAFAILAIIVLLVGPLTQIMWRWIYAVLTLPKMSECRIVTTDQLHDDTQPWTFASNLTSLMALVYDPVVTPMTTQHYSDLYTTTKINAAQEYIKLNGKNLDVVEHVDYMYNSEALWVCARDLQMLRSIVKGGLDNESTVIWSVNNKGLENIGIQRIKGTRNRPTYRQVRNCIGDADEADLENIVNSRVMRRLAYGKRGVERFDPKTTTSWNFIAVQCVPQKFKFKREKDDKYAVVFPWTVSIGSGESGVATYRARVTNVLAVWCTRLWLCISCFVCAAFQELPFPFKGLYSWENDDSEAWTGISERKGGYTGKLTSSPVYLMIIVGIYYGFQVIWIMLSIYFNNLVSMELGYLSYLSKEEITVSKDKYYSRFHLYATAARKRRITDLTPCYIILGVAIVCASTFAGEYMWLELSITSIGIACVLIYLYLHYNLFKETLSMSTRNAMIEERGMNEEIESGARDDEQDVIQENDEGAKTGLLNTYTPLVF